MIDVRRVRQDPDAARAALARRLDRSALDQLEKAIKFDTLWRDHVRIVESNRAEINALSLQIAKRKQLPEEHWNSPPVPGLIGLLAEAERCKAKIHQAEAQLKDFEALRDEHLLNVPNFLLETVPDGEAAANRVARSWGAPREFDFAPKPHWDLGASLGLFDLPRGAKVAGSGFPLYVGMGARLVRALANFFLDLHTRDHGYLEVQPPYLVNRASLTGSGQLPKFEEDLYRTVGDDLFLIPTAEVPVTNIHRDEILDAADLPIAMVAYTPCFRREAGAHGKDTRGLIRVHQFDKVELVRIVRPDESEKEHALITAHAEKVLQLLGLPYRALELAAGDTGFHSACTIDLEVWAPGVGAWLEVSSSSTFTDFQARRANIRFRPAPNTKPEFVHTLNASGVAFPRTIVALLENGQQADGSVILPEALVPYVGTDRLVPRT